MGKYSKNHKGGHQHQWNGKKKSVVEAENASFRKRREDEMNARKTSENQGFGGAGRGGGRGGAYKPPNQQGRRDVKYEFSEKRQDESLVLPKMEITAFPNLMRREEMLDELRCFRRFKEDKSIKSLSKIDLTMLFFKHCATLPQRKIRLKERLQAQERSSKGQVQYRESVDSLLSRLKNPELSPKEPKNNQDLASESVQKPENPSRKRTNSANGPILLSDFEYSEDPDVKRAHYESRERTFGAMLFPNTFPAKSSFGNVYECVDENSKNP